jgi:hypothetical protein
VNLISKLRSLGGKYGTSSEMEQRQGKELLMLPGCLESWIHLSPQLLILAVEVV